MSRQLGGMLLRPGLRVGLLGGSFDPPHVGHVHLSREALKRFGLDRVIWLVTPGNPLKPRPPAPLDQRMQWARDIAVHPDIGISDVEARIGTSYTAETLDTLSRRYLGVRFVWLMGADNLAQLHKWENWHGIMGQMPLGVLARPGQRVAARTSFAAKAYRSARIGGPSSRLLPDLVPPAWCFVNMPMLDISSTKIRAQRES